MDFVIVGFGLGALLALIGFALWEASANRKAARRRFAPLWRDIGLSLMFAAVLLWIVTAVALAAGSPDDEGMMILVAAGLIALVGAIGRAAIAARSLPAIQEPATPPARTARRPAHRPPVGSPAAAPQSLVVREPAGPVLAAEPLEVVAMEDEATADTAMFERDAETAAAAEIEPEPAVPEAGAAGDDSEMAAADQDDAELSAEQPLAAEVDSERAPSFEPADEPAEPAVAPVVDETVAPPSDEEGVDEVVAVQVAPLRDQDRDRESGALNEQEPAAADPTEQPVAAQEPDALGDDDAGATEPVGAGPPEVWEERPQDSEPAAVADVVDEVPEEQDGFQTERSEEEPEAGASDGDAETDDADDRPTWYTSPLLSDLADIDAGTNDDRYRSPLLADIDLSGDGGESDETGYLEALFGPDRNGDSWNPPPFPPFESEPHQPEDDVDQEMNGQRRFWRRGSDQ